MTVKILHPDVKENKGMIDANNRTKVLVGTHQTRTLIEEAAKIIKVQIDVQVISESGEMYGVSRMQPKKNLPIKNQRPLHQYQQDKIVKPTI